MDCLDNKYVNRAYGFTIVELLVVIVTIGILASFVIVSYVGISQKAIVATLKFDLSNAAKQLKSFQALSPNNDYPTANNCSSPGPTEICLKSSGSSVYTLYNYNNSASPKAFTLEEANGTVTYRITEGTQPVFVNIIPMVSIANITGSTVVGSVLSSGLLNPSGATVSYQWKSSSTVGGVYDDIVGATASTYTLVSSDWLRFIKVTATGIGTYSGSVTSSASAAITDPNWIAGVGNLAGKYVRNSDMSATQYKTSNTANGALQGGSTLLDPKLNPTIDFSEYPAQNACKAIGGRLPSNLEQSYLFADRASYGTFPGHYYWTSQEYDSVAAFLTNFFIGGSDKTAKNTTVIPFRCIAG